MLYNNLCSGIGDINECELYNDLCPNGNENQLIFKSFCFIFKKLIGKCINTNESYKCECLAGFELDKDGKCSG